MRGFIKENMKNRIEKGGHTDKQSLAEAMAEWAYLNGLSYTESIASEEEKKEKEDETHKD